MTPPFFGTPFLELRLISNDAHFGATPLMKFRRATRRGSRYASEVGGLRATLEWLVDHLPMPVALVERDGSLGHCNSGLTRILDEETERGRRRLRGALRELARSMSRTPDGPCGSALSQASLDRLVVRIRTSTRRYRLEPVTCPIEQAVPGLIRVHRSRVAPDAETLAGTWALTMREAEVAKLVAAGVSNKGIAAELGISPHTARRHTESVFRKMGVSSRAALGARLYEEPVQAGAAE